MRIYISSGKHIDKVNKRVDAINQNLNSPEVVFGEGGESEWVQQLKSIGRVLPVAPLIALIAFIHLLIIVRLFGWVVTIATRGKLGRDKEIMQRIAEQHNAPIQEIDKFNSENHIYESPLFWGVGNWGLLMLVPPTVWKFFTSFAGLVLSGLVLLLSGFVLLGAMLYSINDNREERMVAEILKEAERVESACIVVGKGHHQGVGKRLESHNEIDVINPTRTDSD